MLNPSRTDTWLNTAGAWTLALLWLLPLIYAAWSAFHATEFSARFDLMAPLTLDNFRAAWAAALGPLLGRLLDFQRVATPWLPAALRAVSRAPRPASVLRVEVGNSPMCLRASSSSEKLGWMASTSTGR